MDLVLQDPSIRRVLWYNEGMSTQRVDLSHKTFFFWNDRPYRVIKEYRRRNEVVIRDLISGRRMMLRWSDWKRLKEKAFTTDQVAKILGRHPVRVRNWLIDKKIPHPFSLAEFDGIERKLGSTKVNFLWREEDIHRARDYMESTGRKDVMSRAELQALINNDKFIQYAMDENGEFFPLWTA